MPARLGGFVVLIVVGLVGLVAGTGVLTADANRDRTISFYGVNTKETLTIQYMRNGKHIPEAMEKINWMLRDWRRDETTQMDPDLIDLVWEIHNELGSAEPINIISGYRSRTTNELLRRTVGGQASQSRHILGKAMDVTFPDVPVKKLRYSALIRERGGVGYYPTSATPFVHIDTDRVRAWPRLPRMELALLFPNGHTQHVPDDGGPITPEDVRKARAANSELAQQIAELRDLHAHPRAQFQVAVAGAVAAAAAHAAAAGGAADTRRHAPDGSRTGGACGAGRRAAASARRRSDAGEPPAAADAGGRDVGRDARRGCRSGRRRGIGSPQVGGLAQPRNHVRAGARLRRGAPRGAVLPALPDRAVPHRHG